jgi:predicted naringenin-chalcone synthase
VAPSRAVLAEVGNLSSATVLFVLERILRASVPAGDRVIAMAFGPGLTVESARFGVMAG